MEYHKSEFYYLVIILINLLYRLYLVTVAESSVTCFKMTDFLFFLLSYEILMLEYLLYDYSYYKMRHFQKDVKAFSCLKIFVPFI